MTSQIKVGEPAQVETCEGINSTLGASSRNFEVNMNKRYSSGKYEENEQYFRRNESKMLEIFTVKLEGPITLRNEL